MNYILLRHRYTNSVKNSRSYPGDKADADHNLVVMSIYNLNHHEEYEA